MLTPSKTVYIALTLLALFTVVYMIGLEDGRHENPVLIITPSDCGCTTDTDCLEKYGCGGYADPCEEDSDVD